MSQLPFYLAAFVLVIGVLVVIHELGHYLAARFCGVKVLRFSVGFGRILWKTQFGKDRTEWVLSVFPLGGYVKMLDEREGQVAAEEQHRAFNRQGVGKRSLIVAAGPLANFGLAILLYWVVFMHGSEELLPIFGAPPEGTPAAMALIQNGDQARSVDGEPVASWSDLRWMLLQKAVDRESVEIEVKNGLDEIAIRRLYLTAIAEQGWESDALENLGVRFFRPQLPPVIGKVVDSGPGATAGLMADDRIVAVEGQEIAYWHQFVEIVRRSPRRLIHIELLRNGNRVALEVVPEENSEHGVAVGKIGVMVAESSEASRRLRTFVSYGPVEAMRWAWAETWDKSVFSLVMMGKMLLGEVSWRNLSGPVTIADYAGQSARLGVDYYLKFMALVSVSLGVLNLLPIPVLDGGHLLYHMIEVVRRRPLSERAMEIGQQIGLSILFALMAFAFFNDMTRLFNG